MGTGSNFGAVHSSARTDVKDLVSLVLHPLSRWRCRWSGCKRYSNCDRYAECRWAWAARAEQVQGAAERIGDALAHQRHQAVRSLAEVHRPRAPAGSKHPRKATRLSRAREMTGGYDGLWLRRPPRLQAFRRTASTPKAGARADGFAGSRRCGRTRRPAKPAGRSR